MWEAVSFPSKTANARHSPVYEEYSDEECYNCECDCHYECDHDHEACDCEEDYEHTCGPVTIPNPYLQKDPNQMSYQQALEAYRDERDNAARGLDEIGGMFRAAGWEPEPQRQRPLVEDPERLVSTFRVRANHRTRRYGNCSIGSRQWCGRLSKLPLSLDDGEHDASLCYNRTSTGLSRGRLSRALQCELDGL